MDEKTETANAKADENGNFHPVNAFAHTPVLFYSHTVGMVPAFVLDRLAQAHYKDLVNLNVNNNQADIAPLLRTAHLSKWDDEEQYASFANDPFLQAVNHNWSSFLKTVKQPELYTVDKLQTRPLEDLPEYSKPWGGDERLRVAFLGAQSDESTTQEQAPSFWARLFRKKQKRLLSQGDDSPRHRSKARYWMLDEKRKDLMPTLTRVFVQNPLVPLLLRILILIFSAGALALACTIFVYLRRNYDGVAVEQQPSTIMALVVQCFAIVYVIYIASDEYLGKPLGLRDPLGKMKLIMLDLFFIIFSLANMSLAFNALYSDEWVCTENYDIPNLKSLGLYFPAVGFLCRRQRALTAFLFVVLVLWVLTFTVSIVRVVVRVSVIDPRMD